MREIRPNQSVEATATALTLSDATETRSVGLSADA